MTTCPLCGHDQQPEARRDPPLPPLRAPAVVTIHDLSPEERARAERFSDLGVPKIRVRPNSIRTAVSEGEL